MTAPLRERLNLGRRELVSIVGAGGKTTILRTLGEELAATGSRVVLTTTTMLAEDQIAEPACWSDLPPEVEARLSPGVPLFVVAGRVPGKVTGPSTTAVDRIFLETTVDYVIVEADGARKMMFKAPAEHEPVIPEASTTVIVTMGFDAIGRSIADVAHRPDRVAALAGLTVDDLLTVDAAAQVLLHPTGGLKNIPALARVVMALTKVAPDTEHSAKQLATILAAHSRVERVVAVLSTEY
ncbi:MAG: selenium cofactor biosynthesis protein YqeC [Acidimicrobiia bacterium]